MNNTDQLPLTRSAPKAFVAFASSPRLDVLKFPKSRGFGRHTTLNFTLGGNIHDERSNICIAKSHTTLTTYILTLAQTLRSSLAMSTPTRHMSHPGLVDRCADLYELMGFTTEMI